MAEITGCQVHRLRTQLLLIYTRIFIPDNIYSCTVTKNGGNFHQKRWSVYPTPVFKKGGH
jgi:hypothetical protein